MTVVEGWVKAHLQCGGSTCGGFGAQPSPGQAEGQGAEGREVALGFRISVFTCGSHCKQAPSLAHGRRGWAGLGPRPGTSGPDTPTCGLGGE